MMTLASQSRSMFRWMCPESYWPTSKHADVVTNCPSRLDELLGLWNSNRGGWEGEEHRLDRGIKFQDAITGFNPAFANLRLDLGDVKPGDQLSQDKTIYNVRRIYA